MIIKDFGSSLGINKVLDACKLSLRNPDDHYRERRDRLPASSGRPSCRSLGRDKHRLSTYSIRPVFYHARDLELVERPVESQIYSQVLRQIRPPLLWWMTP